ncbi:MAG: TonB-dependent receptor, partial [Desulfosarcina sp.]|nr:TonB-dependent receptor [Desulfobacterales bacterium]
MKRKKISACIFSMVIGLAFASSGQGENLENMETKLGKTVVTATMTPKELKEVPGAFEVITADEIRSMGAETVADALEDAVSLDLDHVAGRGFVPQIRGLGNKRTLVLIDGMRFSSGFRDTTVDLSEVPTEMIERIEIIRGPTSALYGSEGIGGVINIITKKAPKKFSGSAGVRYGMNTYGDAENYIVKTTLGDTLEKIGIIASGQLNNTDRFDRHKDDSYTEIDDVEKYSGMLKLSYDFADSQALSAGVFHTDVDREGIRNKYGLEWDRDADSKRTSTFLQYDGSIAGASVMTRAYYSDFESDRSYVDIGDPYNIPALQHKANQQPDREDFDIKNKLYQIESRASRIFAKSHLVTMGVEYRKEKRSGIENRGETEINKTVHNRAVFLQDDFPLFDCLLFTAGVRLDDHSDFGSEVSPRASL